MLRKTYEKKVSFQYENLRRLFYLAQLQSLELRSLHIQLFQIAQRNVKNVYFIIELKFQIKVRFA